MKYSLLSICLLAALTLSTAALAQTPASPPAGSTGVCKDGTFTSNATRKGACAGHRGVQTWLGAPSPNDTAKNTPAAPTTAAAPAAATGAAAPGTGTGKASAATSRQPQAQGGGPGQVWVNTSSRVYHCMGSKYYGKTKHGEYMTQAAAKAAGNHADHGKECN